MTEQALRRETCSRATGIDRRNADEPRLRAVPSLSEIAPDAFARDLVSRCFAFTEFPPHGVRRDFLLILTGIRIGVASAYLARPALLAPLPNAEREERFQRMSRLWQQLGLTVIDEALLADAIARLPDDARILKQSYRHYRSTLRERV